MEYILKKFPVTEKEWSILDKKYSQLCEYAAWQLFRANGDCSADEQLDISQELKIASITAASYFKRQTYIEACLEACLKYAKDPLTKQVVQELYNLWNNKKHHGASKQKFGVYQEELLEKITKKIVPRIYRPSRKMPLLFNAKFNTYCKAVIWNRHKTLGKMYTREKPLRKNQVSLSEHDYVSNLVVT